MAEPLKNSFKIDVVENLARQIQNLHPAFSVEAFIIRVNEGFEDLELMDRGRKVATLLTEFLPSNYPRAIELLTKTLEAPANVDGTHGMSVFRYLPHSFYIAENGLDHFEESMQAQYELTQRFTAEFCIRPYLIKYPQKTLKRLKQWARDDKVHIRRLVSEGTRPRLPWASRLPEFQKDPEPVVELLEILRDDPELYVRRSVANNLNDIGKDHPALLAEISTRWLQGADKNRQWLIKHALRSAIKRGEPAALTVLGYHQKPEFEVQNLMINPQQLHVGDTLKISLNILNSAQKIQRLMIDLVIHYQKANGQSSPKVFKLNAVEIAAGDYVPIKKSITFKNLTTRKHYPGVHSIELLINGHATPLTKINLQQ